MAVSLGDFSHTNELKKKKFWKKGIKTQAYFGPNIAMDAQFFFLLILIALFTSYVYIAYIYINTVFLQLGIFVAQHVTFKDII